MSAPKRLRAFLAGPVLNPFNLYKEDRMPPPRSETFTDQEVVSLFNGCIDLKKYNALPQKVRERFVMLLRKNRIKAVCFMPQLGFGLRAYMDGVTAADVGHGADDEVDAAKGGKVTCNLEGFWLRCPPKDYETPPPKDWVVVNKYATQYVGVSYPDTNYFDLSNPDSEYYDWRDNRRSAKRFAEEEAKQVAESVQGFAVRYERPRP